MPQSHGGLDLRRNLMPAHHGCNASRGTKHPKSARFELSGRYRAPLSTSSRTAATVGAGLGFGALAGHVFAREKPDGTREFNWFAAVLTGSAAALITDAAL